MTVDLSSVMPFLPELLAGRRLTVLTGAGISAESGLPTFRGAGGLWEGFRAEELATPEAFARDPERVWRWYEWRRALLREAFPNEGHLALARMERLLPTMSVVTQNVDGLHRAAGQQDLVELHGSILRTRCTKDGSVAAVPDAPFRELPPRCARCGALLRPDVVWFGESLPADAWARAEKLAEESAVYLVVGTSSVVAPASSLALQAARAGARVFEVNPEATPLAPLAEGVFRTSASLVLPALARALAEEPPVRGAGTR